MSNEGKIIINIDKNLYKGLMTQSEDKPHEMSAREFLVAYKRMCASFPETDCSKCPIYTPYKDCTDNPCDWDIDKILPAVVQWAAEHPEKKRKTYAEDFLQKFPNARLMVPTEPKKIPVACRVAVYGGMVHDCQFNCIACWNEEMEDENE